MLFRFCSELRRLDLVSDSAYARGYAHGFLLFKGNDKIFVIFILSFHDFETSNLIFCT